MSFIVYCALAALAYTVHERLDLARFNAQANDSACPSGIAGVPKLDGEGF